MDIIVLISFVSARHSREECISVVEFPSSGWPVGTVLEHFLYWWDALDHCGQCHFLARGSGMLWKGG